MRLKKLGSIAEIIAGQSPLSKTYNEDGIGLPFFQGKADFQDKYPKAKTWCTSSKRKEAVQGDILISVRAPVGSVNICDQLSIIGRGLSAIRPLEGINGEYLYYFFKSNERKIANLGTGSTFKAITQEILKKIQIPIPVKDGNPFIDDQIRIATLLSKVESLIAKRKKSIEDLDELLKSTFQEMFGDPIKNEMGWEKKQFDSLLENIDSGWSPKCEAHVAEENNWGVLKLGAVTSCNYNEKENKALFEGSPFKKKLEVKKGDLLFSRKNTYELVAACAYVFQTRPKLMLSDLIFRLVLKKEIKTNPIFLWKLLINSSQRKKIQSFAAGAAGSMPNISKTKLKMVMLPYPPIDLQNKFAKIVEKVESIKEHYHKSLTNLENLYGVLSQKAFKGELDLSRIPLEKEAEPQ